MVTLLLQRKSLRPLVSERAIVVLVSLLSLVLILILGFLSRCVFVFFFLRCLLLSVSFGLVLLFACTCGLCLLVKHSTLTNAKYTVKDHLENISTETDFRLCDLRMVRKPPTMEQSHHGNFHLTL